MNKVFNSCVPRRVLYSRIAIRIALNGVLSCVRKLRHEVISHCPAQAIARDKDLFDTVSAVIEVAVECSDERLKFCVMICEVRIVAKVSNLIRAAKDHGQRSLDSDR